LYEAYREGRESPLEELEVQYADYGMWQREWLQGEVLERQVEYWRKQLAGIAALELPTDHARGAALTGRGATVPFHIADDLTGKLKAMGKSESVTLFMTLLAGFQLLLSRYAGHQDIAVGAPIAGRRWKETEGLIGFFVNTLTLRTQIEPHFSIRDMLSAVRETTLEAYAHQDVPYEKLIEELQPERDLSRAPLFQVTFTWHNVPRGESALPGLTLSEVGVSFPTAKFELMLMLGETEGCIDGLICYARDLYEPRTIDRLAKHLELVLQMMAADTGQRISELALLTSTERHQVLEQWNDTGYQQGPEQCAHELFEQQVQRTPTALALTYEGTHLTYQELDQRANQLAHYLTALGVGPEMQIGVCLERSPEMMVAVLGILKAGGVYVPLDPQYPLDRLDYVLADSGAPVLITQEDLRGRLPARPIHVICLDTEWEQIAKEAVYKPEIQVCALNLSYVIYTSGSTGRPKGVGITHGGACNLALAQSRLFGLGAGSSVLQFASLSFDASAWEWLMTLTSGARLVLAPSETLMPGLELTQLLERESINMVTLPPSALAALPEAHLPQLHTLVVAGEACTPDLAEKWGRNRRMLNAYGPSETTVCATVSAPLTGDAITIGSPIANMQVYVLDEGGQPLPPGVIGELYIGGAGLARAYHGQPELTAARFVPNPFSHRAGDRLYRTGDMARWLPNGNVQFFGRKDHQVKLRGHRIELGEIEAVLSGNPGVADCVVVFRGEHAAEQHLVAYFVRSGAASSEANVAGLREDLRSRLPEYMVPSIFVALQELPLTPNGKVDRKSLPEPERTREEKGYVAPRSATEEILCGIWKEMLKLERMGVEDNFFEVGGHSLLATQVISRVRQVFSVDLPLRDIFESPTVATLASRIDHERQKGSLLESPPILRVRREIPLPLSYAQQRLWFIDQFEPGSATYNIPLAVRLLGELDKQALDRSLHEIVRRHEVLRTKFPQTDGVPVQQIAEELEFHVEESDLRYWPGPSREQEAIRMVQVDAGTPFDLATGPLFRIKLLHLEERDYVLLVTMHHMVSDAWSMGILMREFTELYEAYRIGAPSPLPELAVQYADFSVWQREWLKGEVLERQLDYWRKQLAQVLAIDMPSDHSRLAFRSHRGAVEKFELPEEATRGLRRLSQEQGLTLYMVLLAAFQVLLGQYTGRTDIAVGSPIANRNRMETEGLIGFLVNTIVLRVDLSGDPTFLQLLARVREVVLAAQEHQDLPFEMLVQELHPERYLSQNPVVPVMFSLQTQNPEEASLTGLQVRGLEMPRDSAKFDLLLQMWDLQGRLGGTWEYSTDLFDPKTIQRLNAHFVQLMRSILREPESPIDTLQILSDQEMRVLNQQAAADDVVLGDFSF
jgi:amino acid adenylation domain-containing protein